MIRKVLLSTVAIVAISGTAFAADLPSRRAPPVFVPPPIPVFTWTGFYIGGDIGYGFGKDVARVGAATYNVGSANALLGGGHLGYNFSTQSLPLLAGLGSAANGLVGGGLVVGVEGDITGSDYRRSVVFEQDKSDIQGSVRGRVGIAVDRALFFATGGAAFAEFRDNYNLGNLGNFNLTHTRVGYTVGGGIEYAITTAFSLRAEYRYSNFGTYTDNLGFALVSHRVDMQRATVGFSYKFESPMAAPVVARY